jgi:hypothetical protein
MLKITSNLLKRFKSYTHLSRNLEFIQRNTGKEDIKGYPGRLKKSTNDRNFLWE